MRSAIDTGCFTLSTSTGWPLRLASPAASMMAPVEFGPPRVGTSTRTCWGSNTPRDRWARMRFCSSSVIFTLGTVSRRPSGAMNEVKIATTTMIENICWFRMPSDSPMVATTSSIAPRAFMATAMDRLSQKRSPPHRPPSVHPDQLAQAGDGHHQRQHAPAPQVLQVHLQADGAEEDRRQEREHDRLQLADGLLLQLGHLAKRGPGDERPEHGVDADPFGGGPAGQRDDDQEHQIRVRWCAPDG